MTTDKSAGTPAPKREWIPPTPEQVSAVLMKAVGHIPTVSARSPITLLSFNGRYLTKEKAERLKTPLSQLLTRAHLTFVQETNVDALRFLAKSVKYGLNASHRNAREQACGILFHPRFQWLGDAPTYHDYLRDVPGHPEMQETLRPGIQRRVVDGPTGWTADLVDLHIKSNVGEEQTAEIRRWQLASLVAELARQKAQETPAPETEIPVIIGGDYNAPIENPATTEIEPLIEAGFTRVGTSDNRWSYKYFEKGGQFDGFFVRGIDATKVECFIPEFFTNRRDAAFMRELSDHLPVFMTVLQ